MNMEEMQKQQDRKNKNFILTKLIPFFVFLILAVSLILAVIYEKTHLNRLSQRLTDAGQKEIIIEQKISALQEEKEQIQRQFVIDSNLKTNIIFCFNDFENSSYHSIIESMKNYGNPGVIVFRTDNMPGMDGSITIEEYKELLKMLDLGLEDRMTSKVGLLSGGQRQALTLLMATLKKPKLLLLDEHTAALDPKTAAKVLETTEMIVNRDHLTTLMITHNMKDAIKYGNRLIMMHEGHIIYDVSGEEKKNLQVSDLLAKFQIASGGEFANDRMILS